MAVMIRASGSTGPLKDKIRLHNSKKCAYFADLSFISFATRLLVSVSQYLHLSVIFLQEAYNTHSVNESMQIQDDEKAGFSMKRHL